jgi:hypothetical protein
MSGGEKTAFQLTRESWQARRSRVRRRWQQHAAAAALTKPIIRQTSKEFAWLFLDGAK